MAANRCDNRSVGVLIADTADRLLMFDRNTFPPGVAGAAGHVDEHGDDADAARIEVSEEIGLTVVSLTPVTAAWRGNRCRRAPGPAGVGHLWRIYRAQVTGTLAPSARETRNVRWLTPGQLQTLTDRTAGYAHGRITDDDFTAFPGIEPVWVAWLVTAGVVTATPADLAAIDQLASRGTSDSDQENAMSKVKICIYCLTRYTHASVMDGPNATTEDSAYCSHECVGADIADMER